MGVILGGMYSSDYGIMFFIVLFPLIALTFINNLNPALMTICIGILIVLLGAERMDSFQSIADSKAREDSSVIVEIEEVERSDKPWKKTLGRLTHIKTKYGMVPCSEPVLFYTQTQFIEGDIIFLKTSFQEIENARNPGEFDAKSYWNNKSIRKMAFIGESEFRYIDHKDISHITLFFKSIRSNLTASLTANLSRDQAGIAKALLLGDKSTLSMETKKSFGNAGAMHVLAVSGLHVGIIMYLLLFVLSKFSRFISRRKAVLICVILVWIYAGITGFSPSVMRAAFMFSVLMLGQVWSKNGNSINTLFFSAFVLLLINPLLINDIGFQLSYLAVLGILLMYKRVRSLLLIKNKWLNKIWEGTAVGISAQILTVPLSLYYFHQFPNYFMLSNLGVMVFAGVLLAIGLALFTFKAIAFLKPILVFVLGLGISLLFFFIQFVESIPGSVATGFSPSAMIVLFLYALIVILILARKNKRLLYVGSLMALILLTGLQWDRYERMNQNEMVFYNVGSPTISIKSKGQITCFYIGKKDDLKRAHFLLEGYSKVKPGSVKYVELKEGKTKYKSKLGTVEFTNINRDVYLEMNGKTYFLRSNYKQEERMVDVVIDLPYLAKNQSNYNLKSGAYIVEL